MGVISLRLKDRDLERLDELCKALHKDKSTMARELLEYGWDFLMLKYYLNPASNAHYAQAKARVQWRSGDRYLRQSPDARARGWRKPARESIQNRKETGLDVKVGLTRRCVFAAVLQNQPWRTVRHSASYPHGQRPL